MKGKRRQSHINAPIRSDLLAAMYDQIRLLARQKMAGERRGHTLQATALVHEAFMRMAEHSRLDWEDRGQVYLAASEAMRRILIDHARKRGRIKRGGDRHRVSIDADELGAEQEFEEILAVHESLERLEEVDRQSAAVVRLRFFAGLSVDETAEVLGMSPRSVARDWAFARAWLHRTISGDEQGAGLDETGS